MLSRWNRELSLASWHEARGAEEVLPGLARRFVSELARDPLGRLELARLLHDLGPRFGPMERGELESAALIAIERGDLRVVRRARASVFRSIPTGGEAPPEPAAERDEAPAAPVAPAHWIEIELVDADGAPVPHARFELVSESGKRHVGILDHAGFARVEPLDDAQYELRFPALPADQWEAA